MPRPAASADATPTQFWYPRAGVLTAFYILVLQQILQGLYSLWDGLRWLRMTRKRLGLHPGFYAPRVAVLCPCKGAEPGLEENLSALTLFDYADYEVYFVISSALDPARKVIDRVAGQSPRTAHVVVAGAPKDCSEKVHNLRKAVEEAGEKFDVFVFTDSDARLVRGWLSRLVAPLADSRLGAATTFRWLLPSGNFAKSGIWSGVASAWNAALVTMLGEDKRNFCWGGGTAIRRTVFEEARVLEHWEGAASDDWAMTRALDAASRPILFVPECLAPTIHDTNFDQLLEFTTRQMILTRVYAPRMWLMGSLAHLSYSATALYSLWLILVRIVTGDTWGDLALLALAVPLLAAMKGALRSVAVEEVLPEWRPKLQEWSWAWTWLAPVVPLLYLRDALVSAATRQIRWRGLRYEVVAPTQTRVLSH